MDKQIEWRVVPGYDNYKVSEFGDIISLPKKLFNSKGSYTTKEKLFKPYKQKSGHYMTRLVDNNGISKGLGIHVVTALAFVPNPYNLPIVEHIDDNPENNYYKNLIWSNQSSNTLNRYYRSSRDKIKSVLQYNLKGDFISEFESASEAGRSLNINNGFNSISQCCRGINKSAYGFIWKFKIL